MLPLTGVAQKVTFSKKRCGITLSLSSGAVAVVDVNVSINIRRVCNRDENVVVVVVVHKEMVVCALVVVLATGGIYASPNDQLQVSIDTP
ncbi:hypothetical protein RJT34_32639 [Clitoria ternatea]|uniref:Uncharacterized protein n=1 Tax=Clitoria ternatea TaxID=43366 RepID=A0AAN9F4D9_CLITE